MKKNVVGNCFLNQLFNIMELHLIIKDNIWQCYKYFSITLAMDKKCRYFKECLNIGFTSIEKPQCVLCNVVLSGELMKPLKLEQHLETKHPSHVIKD